MSEKLIDTRPALLLVDDDAEIRDQMKWALASDYQLLEASDRSTALARVRHAMPRLVLLDLGLPPDTDGASEGLAILRETLELNPTAKVIVVTGNSDRAKAVAAIESGAYDFIEKPVQLDVLKILLQRAAYLSNIEQENRALQERAGQNEFEGLVGNSARIQDVVRMIRRVGPSEVPVLITGESGTGKELVARAIHRQSARRTGPFVAINCGAIPETLLESELFGHEKGAFTGATQQRKGRIESAQHGTLFLDEIGDIPLGLQVKLLRFLQDHTIQRLGAKETIAV
ncbi:MAG: sigma 54-interacting transcriptional regulator, partial [Nitrospiraceae bacterium]